MSVLTNRFRFKFTSFHALTLILLTLIVVGLVASAIVFTQGLIVTNLTDLVPWGLWIIVAPSGSMPWISFCWGISRLRRVNMLRTWARASSFMNSRVPVASAMACRVRSSAVGPSPPVAMMTSARPIAWRKTSAMASSRSPTVV